MKHDFNYWIVVRLGFSKKKNLRFFIEIDLKSLSCLAIVEFFLREIPFPIFKGLKAHKRTTVAISLRRIRLQFLNCPAFELSKIYGQGNGLSVSRPEITQFLTSWETRLPGKLSLFNVSFSSRCWKNMNFRFVGFNIPFLSFFFFLYNPRKIVTILSSIGYTMHGPFAADKASLQRAENRVEEARFERREIYS